MSTTTAPVPAPHALSVSQQRAALLGIRAARKERDIDWCFECRCEVGTMGRHGACEGRYSRGCEVEEIPWADELEDEIAALPKPMRDVAEKFRRVMRQAMAEAREDRDDDARARGEG